MSGRHLAMQMEMNDGGKGRGTRKENSCQTCASAVQAARQQQQQQQQQQEEEEEEEEEKEEEKEEGGRRLKLNSSRAKVH